MQIGCEIGCEIGEWKSNWNWLKEKEEDDADWIVMESWWVVSSWAMDAHCNVATLADGKLDRNLVENWSKIHW